MAAVAVIVVSGPMLRALSVMLALWELAQWYLIVVQDGVDLMRGGGLGLQPASLPGYAPSEPRDDVSDFSADDDLLAELDDGPAEEAARLAAELLPRFDTLVSTDLEDDPRSRGCLRDLIESVIERLRPESAQNRMLRSEFEAAVQDLAVHVPSRRRRRRRQR